MAAVVRIVAVCIMWQVWGLPWPNRVFASLCTPVPVLPLQSDENGFHKTNALRLHFASFSLALEFIPVMWNMCEVIFVAYLDMLIKWLISMRTLTGSSKWPSACEPTSTWRDLAVGDLTDMLTELAVGDLTDTLSELAVGDLTDMKWLSSRWPDRHVNWVSSRWPDRHVNWVSSRWPDRHFKWLGSGWPDRHEVT